MAALQIAERQAGDVTILDLWGQITIGETSEALRSEIGRLADGSQKKILLHMAGVRQVDSSGLGNLVACFTSVQRKGGELKLVKLSERIQDLMLMTKLLTVFDVHESEEQALGSFK